MTIKADVVFVDVFDLPKGHSSRIEVESSVSRAVKTLSNQIDMDIMEGIRNGALKIRPPVKYLSKK